MKTPNLIYWKPIREFWGRIKDNEILTGSYSGLEWDDLPDHSRADLAEVFKAAVSCENAESSHARDRLKEAIEDVEQYREIHSNMRAWGQGWKDAFLSANTPISRPKG